MNATLALRLSALFDRITSLLYFPHRAPLRDVYLSGAYDLTTRVIPGHALTRVLREQRVAPRSRLSA